jgi:hypothetical protein
MILVIDCMITAGWYRVAIAGSGYEQSGRRREMK